MGATLIHTVTLRDSKGQFKLEVLRDDSAHVIFDRGAYDCTAYNRINPSDPELHIHTTYKCHHEKSEDARKHVEYLRQEPGNTGMAIFFMHVFPPQIIKWWARDDGNAYILKGGDLLSAPMLARTNEPPWEDIGTEQIVPGFGEPDYDCIEPEDASRCRAIHRYLKQLTITDESFAAPFIKGPIFYLDDRGVPAASYNGIRYQLREGLLYWRDEDDEGDTWGRVPWSQFLARDLDPIAEEEAMTVYQGLVQRSLGFAPRPPYSEGEALAEIAKVSGHAYDYCRSGRCTAPDQCPYLSHAEKQQMVAD